MVIVRTGLERHVAFKSGSEHFVTQPDSDLYFDCSEGHYSVVSPLIIISEL